MSLGYQRTLRRIVRLLENGYVDLGEITDVSSEIAALEADVVILNGAKVPAGGTDDQVLTKVSSTDYDMAWETPVVSSNWTLTGTDIYNNNAGNVGIGTVGPSEKLDVSGNVRVRDRAGLGTRMLTVSTTGVLGDAALPYTQAQLDAGQLNTIYYTETEVDSLLGGKANTSHTHVEADITDLGSYLTDAPSDGNDYVRNNGAWAIASGGGGGGVYTIAKFTANSTAQSFSNVEAQVQMPVVAFNTGSDISVNGTNRYTINSTGTYKISFTCHTNNNNRTELILRLYVNSVFQTGEIASNYVSRDTDQNTGGVTLDTAVQLTAGDDIYFTAEGDCDGTCTKIQNGTRLIVERVA